MTALTLDIPLAKPLPSLANSRMHWRALASLKKAQRHRTALHMRHHVAMLLWALRKAGNETFRIACTLTRIGPRDLDGDNLQGAFKAIRDQVAEECGLDDGSKRWDWHYAQERGAPGYRIRLEVLTQSEVAT